MFRLSVAKEQGLALVLVVLSLVAMGIGAKASIDAHNDSIVRDRYAKCQAGVDDALVKALSARSDSSAARTDATDQLIDSVFQAKSKDEVHVLYLKWRAARQQAIDERQRHPFPQPPSTACHF